MHEVFERQAVSVQVKSQCAEPRCHCFSQLGFVLHRGQMTPLFEDVNVSTTALRVVFPQANLAGVWPHLQPVGTERQLQAEVVQLQVGKRKL